MMNDACVFLDALARLEANFPHKKKYYLVNYGYPCTFGFYHHIKVNDIIYKNIKINVINLSSIKNFLIIDIHPL